MIAQKTALALAITITDDAPKLQLASLSSAPKERVFCCARTMRSTSMFWAAFLHCTSLAGGSILAKTSNQCIL